MSQVTLSSAEYEFKASPTDGWIITKFSLKEKLNRPYHCVLELVKDAKTATPAELLGLSCSVSITRHSAADGSTAVERDLKGIIHRVENLGIMPNFSQYAYVRIHLAPALHALSMTLNSRIFQNQKVTDILQTVLGGGLQPYQRSIAINTKRTFISREYTVQHRESDFDFAQRLMAHEGIGYFFDHSGDAEKMTLFDSNSSCPAAMTAAGSAELPTALITDQTESLSDFSTETQLMPNAVEVTDFDWTQPSLSVDQKAQGSPPDKITRTIYDSAPALSYNQPTPGAPANQQATPYNLLGDPINQASLREQAFDLRKQLFFGVSNALGVQPGTFINTTDTPDLNGKYLVVGAEHEGLSQLAVTTFAGNYVAAPSYTNTFDCLAFGQDFRPERMKEETRVVLGPQTATVVGPKGQEVYVDSYGRIKIQFHWDQSAGSESSSCFVRCAQVWAGKSFGAMFLPRVGMEVVVQFLDGNPDRPLVTGCVYNGSHPVPWSLPMDSTKSGFITSSSPGGAGNNELTFEDQTGSEKITMTAQKDLGVTVKNNQTVNVIGQTDFTTGGHYNVTVGGAEHHLVNGLIRTDIIPLGAHIGLITLARADATGLGAIEAVGLAKLVAVGGLLSEIVGAARIEEVIGVKSETIGMGSTLTVTAGGLDESVLEGDISISAITGEIDISATMGPLSIQSGAATSVKLDPLNGVVVSDGVNSIKTDPASGVKISDGMNTISLSPTDGISIDAATAGSLKFTSTGVTLQDITGNSVAFASTGVTIKDVSGNSLAFAASGVTIKDASGNSMTLSPAGVAHKGSPIVKIN